MYEINCVDETFDPNFTTEYILSIQVGLDGFSFCILDDIRKKHLVFKHYPFLLSNNLFLLKEIDEIFKKEEILSKNYKRALISFASNKFTTIPLTDQENYTDSTFTLNHVKEKDELILNSTEDFFKLNIIYTVPSGIYNFITEKFEKPEISHQLKVLLGIISRNSNSNRSEALISVSKRYFTIILLKEGKLNLINSYNYSNNMDFIYYVLQVFKTTELNMSESGIFLAGEIKEDSHLVEFIRKHFNKVEFIKLAKGYQYSYTFSDIPSHMFAGVINPEG
ncbi:MAG: DUF3822 family protein [Prolixibacteraceae bacterium]|nr:DUF3822 family protein [Prolixibacteraceae bacterium]MBN2775587.1 DUF3822 family protein [Prolixibacteraceae bacterium]